MKHFAVGLQGSVEFYTKASDATARVVQMGNGAFYANETAESLKALPTALMVVLYNTVRPERPIARFANRGTAEKRLIGVLEVLAKKGEPVTAPESKADEPTTAPVASATVESATPENGATTEETDMAAKAKKAAAKKTARAPKGERKNAPAEISEATVRRVIKMRQDAQSWPEIIAALGETNGFVHRVRPLMKKLDRKSVLALGPGSVNYGKIKKGKK
jgi:hypothetical protein